MEAKKKKRFFTNHSKSSAMVVSLALHAILLVVALSFVAVTVVTKDDKKFESRQVIRPRMPPKKLQVPVKIKKQKRKPKLRQRIVVKPSVNRNMPDIKMPEITGIKGGLGAAGGAGLGGAGGVGFSMPEIEVFGVRSKGEKVFIALDSDAIMMRDEVGGMRAYTIIKDELTKIIGNLGPTTLFNLAVFEHGSTTTLFPRMVPATRENVAKVENWLEPLNKVSKGMGDKAYGTKTLGKGGTRVSDNLAAGKIRPTESHKNSTLSWYIPAALAMKQQADTVFILSGWWGVLRYAEKEFPVWTEANRKRWEQRIREGNEKLAEENKIRRANDEPPKVIRDHYHLVHEYFPAQFHSIRPPEPPWYYYTPRDFAEALKRVRKENAPKLASKSGISKKKKDSFSVNVIYFARKDDADAQAGEIERFNELANRSHGKFRSIAGLEAIQSSVSK
ncbi:MAG: hypothetical protein DRP64_07265 [Verrucomicrobia bacterium]|nr:MAG: hypothetical protein DRP64_07265 [Verrucomicrobiota bacterium]